LEAMEEAAAGEECGQGEDEGARREDGETHPVREGANDVGGAACCGNDSNQRRRHAGLTGKAVAGDGKAVAGDGKAVAGGHQAALGGNQAVAGGEKAVAGGEKAVAAVRCELSRVGSPSAQQRAGLNKQAAGYQASRRLLMMAGVTLRQHVLGRTIVIHA
jgi:hypothetical protein